MSEEHKEATRKAIAVMQAYLDGKLIEGREADYREWVRVCYPVWNWFGADYRIATIPDSIDWSHVAPEFKYMARGERGPARLHVDRPVLIKSQRSGASFWCSSAVSTSAENYASYQKGTVDWKDSLVVRPE